MEVPKPSAESPQDDMRFESFSRPILDELSCSENLKEFHSLNAEEVEANLLADWPKPEMTVASTSKGHNRSNTDLIATEKPTAAPQVIAEEADLGNIFFKRDSDDVKLEFKSDEKQLVDRDFASEYFIDDLCEKEHAEDFLQVEVYSTPASQEVCEDKHILNSSSESIGVLESISDGKFSLQPECNNNDVCTTNTTLPDDESILKAKVDDNSQLSNIMSDHNYTSQELTARAELPVETLRHNLINHLLRRSCSGTDDATVAADSPEVEDFVKEILERVNAFTIAPVHPKIEELDACANSDRDTFLQTIMDTVVAEDAAEEDINESISMLGAIISPAKCKNEATANEQNIDTMKTCKLEPETTDDGSVAAEQNDSIAPADASIIVQKEAETETHANSQSFTLPENCSEPMEHTSCEDIFDHLTSDTDDKIDHKPNEHCMDILEKLISFGNKLNADCSSFLTASTNIEEKLQHYIETRLNELKSLTNIVCMQADKGLQTEQRISKRKLKKINSRNKKALLQSSDSSDTSVSSTEMSANSDLDESPVASASTLPVKMRRARIKSKNVAEPKDMANDCNRNCISEYDDGVPLTQYIQSEIFESDIFSNESSMSAKISVHRETFRTDNESCASDNDNPKQPIAAKRSSNKSVLNHFPRSESDKENANLEVKSISKPIDKLEEADKEIERLINLNGLTKRTIYNGSTKTGETDKSRTKSQSQAKKQNLLDFMGDDQLRDAASDDSISESEEEIITEKQYLARCNENLKQQLLNASSGDSDVMEQTDDELAEVLSDDAEDADGNKSPKIEKFLKTFNIEESDNENDIEADADAEAGSDKDSSGTKLIEINDTKSALADDEHKEEAKRTDSLDEARKSNANSTDNSDCELLNEHLLLRKRSKPKSLEKMLSEVDKRKRTTKIDDDLISLSSESECSDVEAVDVEAADSNSRIIKPMLRQDQLAGETRKAQKNEADRIRRLEKKQTLLAKALRERSEAHKSGDLILDYNEDTKTFIKVHPGIVKHLKKHQIEGVKFMYDSCYGGVEALKKNGGSGCILAHCMGLGKTLQLIALLHTVITYKELKTTKILVLCPKSTVMNWADEIVRWLGPLNTKNVKVYTFSDSSDIYEKLSVMKEWSLSTQAKAGCLLIGYEAFRTLVFYHSYKNRGNVSTARLEDIRDKVVKYLLKPGADLVVCDEGHIIKNSKSAISLAVAQIITPKRIVLTGTPIQNNLKEYYSMVNFIKPLFLGTEKEFANLYANPIKNGQHKDSSKRDIKVMKQRSFVLHKKLSKFVQRKEAELLKSFLPQKFEYVLFIPMTNVQNNLYEHILAAISRREENRGRSLITDYTCLRKIWTHPKVLEDAWINATNQKNRRDARKNQIPHSDDDQPDDIYDSQTGVMSVTNDWWRHLLTSKDLESILPSNKLRTMFEILRMCEEKGEKCLIFSAFVAVLNVVEHFFKKITSADPETLRHMNIPANKAKNAWISGQDYYRLDGKTPKSIRHEMIKRFNSSDNMRARVFLISAKAGGQGINLIGANRVIILDTSWNPSNDQQNIFRIFRLGQKKNCYIYRLLAMGTMEEKVYSRSVTKQAMSYRVVDEQQIDRHYSMAELAELYTLTIPNSAERPTPIFPQDNILVSLLRNFPDMAFKYHEHDSLLENKVEQELSEQEKADAWAAYERDLQLSSEIRGLPNVEEMQNNLAAAKMQNYLGALAGLDMQTLLNYSGLGQQATPAPYTHSLLSQYNYPATSQQYLEMANLYRKYAQSSLGYTEMGKTLGENPYGASTFGALSAAQKSMPTSSAAMMSGLHGGPATSANPLSALGDLSMYGIGAPKNMPTNSNTPPILAQHTPMHANVPTSNASMHGSNAPSALLQNVFQNYYNYANDYRTASSAAKSTFPSPSPAHVNPMNQYMNAPPYQSPLNSSTSEPASRQEKLSYLQPALPPTPTAEPPKKQATVDSGKGGQSLAKDIAMSSVIRHSESGNKTQSNMDKSLSLTSIDSIRSARPTPPLVDSLRSTRLAPTPPIADSLRSTRPTPTPPLVDSLRSTRPTPTPPIVDSIRTTRPTPTPPLVDSLRSTRPTPTSPIVDSIRSIRPTPTPPLVDSLRSTRPTSVPKRSTPTPQAAKPNLLPTVATTANAVKQKMSTAATTTTSGTSTTTNGTTATMSDAQRSLNMGISYPKSNSISASTHNPKSSTAAAAAAASLNMGIIYPNTNASTAPANAAISTERLKRSSEMQIIPTTSPPGTGSVSKQLNALLPSISLTAVRNIAAANVKALTTAASSKLQGQKPGLPNSISNNAPASQQPTNSGGKNNKSGGGGDGRNTMGRPNNSPSISNATLKPNLNINRNNKLKANIKPSVASAPVASGSATMSALAKAVAAKSKVTPAFQSNFQNTATPTSTKSSAQAATITPSIKKQVMKTAQNSLLQNNRRTGSPIAITTTKTVTPASISSATSPASSVKHALSNQKAMSNKSHISLIHPNAASGSATTYLTPAQLQKRVSATTTATTMPAVKSALNIRPVDNKQSSSGTGVYIIETNINEKRVAIGAPTKSGGGTTITKIAPKKRKTQDISFIEAKRAKF